MADVKNEENEPALPSKRKPDLTSVETDIDDAKKQKLESPDVPEEKIDEHEAAEDVDDEEEDEEEEFEDDDDDDDEDEDGEHSNGKAAVVDRKGKGIMKEDKGKGKLIEEEEEDDSDDDDSSDGDGELDGDSDLSDDSLAEVDLDNILPSRTRRRVINPNVYLANDLPRIDEADSDDSDA